MGGRTGCSAEDGGRLATSDARRDSGAAASSSSTVGTHWVVVGVVRSTCVSSAARRRTTVDRSESAGPSGTVASSSATPTHESLVDCDTLPAAGADHQRRRASSSDTGGGALAVDGTHVDARCTLHRAPTLLRQKGKGSPYSISECGVPELIPVLDSQPAGDVSHKPGGRLPLLSARPAVTPATLKRAATSFAAW